MPTANRYPLTANDILEPKEARVTLPFDAVIFDLDGVLTDTAEYHYRAWKRLADEEGLPFDRQTNEQLRGVSRQRSLEILLAGRKVTEEQFREMLDRKNQYYRELLHHLGPEDLLPGALPLVRALREAGVKVAIGTVSKNAPLIVERLGLDREVDLVADGHSVERSKPAPDIFLYAALHLGVPPERCVVVEDAAAGIDAALAAGMWAVGLGPAERVGHAHVRFPNLQQVALDTFVAAVASAQAEAARWTVEETTLQPDRLPAQEAVFTVGNGYVGTRGTFEEGFGHRDPLTLIAGLWDDVPIVHTELVNAPDWTGVDIWVNGERFHLEQGTLLRYRRTLDMHQGVLRRTVRWQSPAGAVVDITWERFAVWHRPHLLAQRVWVTPVSGPVTVRVRLRLDALTPNDEVYHWHRVDEGEGWIHLTTRNTNRHLVMGQAVTPWGEKPLRWEGTSLPGQWGETFIFSLQPSMFAGVDRLVAVYTDREAADPWAAVQEALSQAQQEGFDRIRVAHREAWAQTWQQADVRIDGDETAQRAVRFNVYHLLIAAPRHTDRVSIGAKTLSGTGYRGHVFWDTEIFMLPFFTFVQPETARRLLMYRYHTLPGARRKAQAGGYAGAQYAWESAETGDEVTPRWAPGPDGEPIRIWCGDIELHISSDVPYAIWQYWQVTGDDAFFRDYGAEIILETARFWESRVEWNEAKQRYEINDVIGPDEYHEHVNNNAFTNELVRWHLERAEEVVSWLQHHAPERWDTLARRLDLSPKRLARWAHIRDHLYVPQDPETGLIEQFEGFFRLKDIDLASYEPRRQSMQAILGIEGANQHQVLKQPDVLMLLYLLPDRFSRQALVANWEYYTPRTDHTFGSSLGPAVHAILAAWLNRPEEAYDHFLRAALVDLEDSRGNTVDGIHAASCGGVWQAVVFGFAGLHRTPEGWAVSPCLPPHWRQVRFRFCSAGQWFQVTVQPGQGTVHPLVPHSQKGGEN